MRDMYFDQPLKFMEIIFACEKENKIKLYNVIIQRVL